MSINNIVRQVILAILIAVPTHGFYYKVDEGFRGLVSYNGAYNELLLIPGDAGFTRPNIWPFFVRIDYIEIRPQEDSAKRVQCGAKDGSIHWIDSIEIGNTLDPSSVYTTVKKYGIDYDQKLIMNKVRFQMNVICSKLDTYDIFVTQFDQLDDMLQKFLQGEQDRLDTGISIDYVRLSKPKLPKDQADTFEGISKQQIQQKLEDQKKITKMKEAENAKIEAEAHANRAVIEAEGKFRVAEQEAAAHLAKEKAKSDAESYRKIEEAKANQYLFGGPEQYLDYERHKAIASNSKVYFGGLPNTIWTADSLGITNQD
jgi:regulator of protease activity HflC (stomatin/prohibitin superfamily)